VKEFFERLFSSDFMGHGYCYLWKPEIVWLHAISDSLIALSYLVIPITLVVFVRKRTLWNGTYRLAGGIKAITAGASVATAVALVPLIPRALLLPSPSQLRAANQELEKENAERRRAEAEQQVAHNELELRVQQRTAELARANEQLQAEILERRRAETFYESKPACWSWPMTPAWCVP